MQLVWPSPARSRLPVQDRNRHREETRPATVPMRETMVHSMRWNVRKLRPGWLPTEVRRWVSEPASLVEIRRRARGNPVLETGLRYHHTHAEALQRAIVKAYGPQPRKATP